MNAKKIVCAALAAGLTLTGCSSSSSSTGGKEVDGQYVLASVDGKNFTADDFYDSIINTSNATNVIYDEALMALVNKYNPVNDDMQAELDTLKETYQSYIDNGYESYLLYQISYYGYNTLDEYYESYLEYLQIEDFLNDYLEAHYDEIFEDYYEVEAPKKVYHILVSMEDSDNPTEEEWAKVEEIQELLNLGKDFQETAKDYSDDSTAEDGGYLGVCGNSSSFVDEFMDMMNTLEPGTISEPFKTTYGYHFMYIEDVSKEDLKEELNNPDSVIRNWGSSDFYDSYLEYVVFDSYDITYNDETIETNLKAYIESMLEARESSRES